MYFVLYLATFSHATDKNVYVVLFLFHSVISKQALGLTKTTVLFKTYFAFI